VQRRDKDVGDDAYLVSVRETVAAARRHGARTLLNGRWSLLADTGADGVQVPSSVSVAAARAAVGPRALIGHSTHSRDEIRVAVEGGADFVTLSPVFPTESKPGAPTLGLDELAALAAECPLPVFALGGVTAQNARACVSAGAFGVAVCGAILSASGPASATGRLLEALQ